MGFNFIKCKIIITILLFVWKTLQFLMEISRILGSLLFIIKYNYENLQLGVIVLENIYNRLWFNSDSSDNK